MSVTPIFSHQFLQVLAATNGTIQKVVSQAGGVAVTDYCILQELIVAARPMGLSEFKSFLLLRRNTVSAAVSRLEERGLVSKCADERDSRKATICLTVDGRNLADGVSHAIRDALLDAFWKVSADERVNWGMMVDSRVFVENGLGIQEGAPSLDDESLVIPAWIMALRYIDQLWTTTLASSVRLSLSEFRTLDLLAEEGAPLRQGDIAGRLRIETSALSRIVRSLRLRELVQARRSDDDKRSFIVEITPEGEAVSTRGRDLLVQATDRYYVSLTEQERDRLRDWHRRMYANFEAVGLDA